MNLLHFSRLLHDANWLRGLETNQRFLVGWLILRELNAGWVIKCQLLFEVPSVNRTSHSAIIVNLTILLNYYSTRRQFSYSG